MGYTKKRTSWTEVEELVNAALNLVDRNQSELERALQIGAGTFGTWRKSGSVPGWLPIALRGFIGDRAPQGEGSPATVQVGMRLTTEQLEVLNEALAVYARSVPDARDGARRVRASVLLELAARLEAR